MHPSLSSTAEADGRSSTREADGLNGYTRVCPLDDVWQGETLVQSVDGVPVLLCHTESGGVHAIQAECPHQAVPLSGGSLDGDVITCPMHLWRMNIATGQGVNPCHARLARYPVKVVEGDVWVSCLDIEPEHCRP